MPRSGGSSVPQSQAHEDVTEEINRSVDRSRSRPLPEVVTQRHMPKQIGHYHIKRLIGEGGIGAVYEAVQTQPRRTVAVKVLRSGSVSASALRRFEYESQLLARLRHPGIAQVYEAGTHDDGVGGPVPYFAMEYIPGAQSITHFATMSGLDTRKKLELFIKVCDAIQHGHQKGIIHRDLKPANILVDTSTAGAGQPKIIDFGVARGSDSDMAEAQMQTEAGMLVGTVQYMSPEQVAADPNDIDVRSDVYALGLILYQLLVGKLPYDVSPASIFAATKIIREQAPARPSVVNTTLKGDIETIVLKSLEKDRAKRYQSAAELAADLQRYLNNEPILARRVGALGRSLRWVKRNRAIATVTGVAALVLIVVSTYLIARVIAEGQRAQKNYELAQKNYERAEESLSAKNDSFEFLKQMFSNISLDNNTKGMVDVEMVLDKAVKKLEASPPKLPETEANIRGFLGSTYLGLDRLPKADDNLKRALDISEKTSPDPSPQLAKALHEYGAYLWWRGEYDKAAPLYERELAMRRKLDPKDNPDVATALTHLAATYLCQGKYQESKKLYTEALKMRRGLSNGKGNAEVAAALNNLARAHFETEEYSEAEDLYRQALAMISAINVGPDGKPGVNIATALSNLASCLLQEGKVEEARKCYADALSIRSDHLKPDHYLVAVAKMGLARAMFASGDVTAAQPLIENAVTILSITSPDHPSLASALEVQSDILLSTDHPNQCEPLLRRALHIFEQARPPVPLEIADTRGRLGACLVKLQRYEEAEQMLSDSLSVIRSTRGDKSASTIKAAKRLIELYTAQGKPERAELYKDLAAGKGSN